MGGCPGQNTQFWGHEAIFDVFCPNCNSAVEFFKDDAQRTCSKCANVVFNPRMDFSCAKWCPSARTCLGEERYNSLMDISNNEENRNKAIEKLLGFIKEEDKDVKKLFRELYMKNKDGSVLFDVKELLPLKVDNPKLFEKATSYFARFTQESAK